MSHDKDIRWEQRFQNFKKALEQLTKFIEAGQLNELEEQGLIKAFEYTYELSWNTLKDYFVYQGIQDLAGSRDTFRKAFSLQLVSDGKVWMRMIECRNRTSHTYNQTTAREIAEEIRTAFFPAYCELKQTLEKKQTQFSE